MGSAALKEAAVVFTKSLLDPLKQIWVISFLFQRIMIGVRDDMQRHSPTMMCSADVTGSLVPTVAKQIQSVEPETSRLTLREQTQTCGENRTSVCIQECKGLN